jgi:hypothetical protein
MDSNQTLAQALKPDEYKVLQQGITQDNERALQEGVPNTTVQAGVQPRYPTWPTSQRGPMTTPPPPGQRPINAQRSEQVAEVGYNQETGEPSPEGLLPPKKSKERL